LGFSGNDSAYEGLNPLRSLTVSSRSSGNLSLPATAQRINAQPGLCTDQGLKKHMIGR